MHLADSVPATAARWSRPAFSVHRLPPPRTAFAAFRAALARLVEATGATLVVPTCEEVFYIAAAAPPARVFAPPPDVLRRLHSKALFADVARAAGVTVPDTHAIDAAAALPALPLDRIVLKPEFSRFAAATLIRPSPRTVARLRPSPTHRWVAQPFVAGGRNCACGPPRTPVASPRTRSIAPHGGTAGRRPMRSKRSTGPPRSTWRGGSWPQPGRPGTCRST